MNISILGLRNQKQCSWKKFKAGQPRCSDIAGGRPEKRWYQVIVVGAGVAGITAAYFLGKAGINVLLLERGPYPGSKSMSGGAVYSLPTNELMPSFWEEAPIERVLIDQQYWLMAEKSAVKVGYTDFAMDAPPYNKFSILRASFDRWYSAKAVEAGAQLWAGCKADSLLMDKKRVMGVRVSGSRQGNIEADIVILAQGVNAMLAERAGLIDKAKAKDHSLYIKELISLPEEIINERLNLTGNQGAVIGLVGDATAGLIGTGSIYTFKKHIGINIGIDVKIMAKKRVNLSQLMDKAKKHPVIAPILKGGTTVEYLAHMIPEGGFNAMPPLVFDGMLIAGDAGALVNGTHGLNLAMFSGKFAAEAAVKALETGDVSRTGLNIYRKKLENSFILRDMRDNRGVTGLLQNNPTLYADYINLLNKVSKKVSTIYPMSRREKRRVIRREVLDTQPVGKMLIDAIQALRVIK